MISAGDRGTANTTVNGDFVSPFIIERKIYILFIGK